MVVKKYFVDQPRAGYQYDRKENKYFSWGYDVWVNRERRSERGFYTKERAEAAAKALREDAQNSRYGIAPKTDSPFLIELFQKKLDTLRVRRDHTRAKRVFTAFLDLLPKNIRVAELKRAHLQLYIEQRIADGVKGTTIKREMVPIIEVLNNADQHFAELDGYRPPKKPRIPISKTRKTVVISYEARQKLLAFLLAPQLPHERDHRQRDARHRVGLFLQMCLLTVSRPGEIASLRKTDVDIHAGIVKIHGSKTEDKKHSTREIPITPTIRAILLKRMEAATGDFLFTRGGYVTCKMYKTLKTACEALMIPYGRHDTGLTFYTARHTATTVLAHSNRVDTKTAGHFTGHSDETMTLYYTHTSPETLSIASQVLEENMGSKLLDRANMEPNGVPEPSNNTGTPMNKGPENRP